MLETQKIKLGMLADFSHRCPVGGYAKKVGESLTGYFAVEYLDLRTAQYVRNGSYLDQALEQNFNQLLPRIELMDVVNIHLEFGLFGNSFDKVEKRILKICELAKQIIITVHSLHVTSPDFAAFYEDLFKKINQLAFSKKVLALVNNERDQGVLERQYGLSNVAVFPIVYFTKEEAQTFAQKNFLRTSFEFSKKLPFQLASDDIVIGCFGFLQPHKDTITVLKALSLLPSQYKLLIVGGQHPGARKYMAYDPVVSELIEYLEQSLRIASNDQRLHERLAFIDDLNDEEFFSVLASVDFVALNYLDTEMSASAVMAQALQLGRRIIATPCRPFVSVGYFFPNCFETMDFGNYFQFRQKVLTFNENKLESLKANLTRWNLNELSALYENFYSKPFVPILSDSISPAVSSSSSVEFDFKKAFKSNIKKLIKKLLGDSGICFIKKCFKR